MFFLSLQTAYAFTVNVHPSPLETSGTKLAAYSDFALLFPPKHNRPDNMSGLKFLGGNFLLDYFASQDAFNRLLNAGKE
jgi:hypothetical protein